MNLIECHKIREDWQRYDVGGSLSNLGDYTQHVKNLKDKYSSIGCGEDPLMEKCLERELYIQNLQNLISEKTQQNDTEQLSAWAQVLAKETKMFNDLGCNAKIQERKNLVLGDKLSKYTAIDKQRIEAESKYQANKKIFTGVSVVLVALVIVILAKSK
jgi:hypothetical protein